MKYIVSILLFTLISCSVYKTRRTFSDNEISIRGGVHGDKDWDSSLTFKRYSWYKDATLSNDLLIAKLDSNSDFAHWMDSDRLHLSQCDRFYIGLLYSGVNAEQGVPFMETQIESSGAELKIILAFTKELKAHQNLRDWHLSRHKVYGICTSKSSESLSISLSGFKTKKITLE